MMFICPESQKRLLKSCEKTVTSGDWSESAAGAEAAGEVSCGGGLLISCDHAKGNEPHNSIKRHISPAYFSTASLRSSDGFVLNRIKMSSFRLRFSRVGYSSPHSSTQYESNSTVAIG